jgi:signal transduction histidine kinase
MFGIKKFIFRALHLGVDQAPPEIAPFITQSNMNGLVYFALDGFLSLVFFLTLDDPYISYGLLTAACLFLISSVGFNYLGWTNLSRLSTVSIGSFLVVYCALYLGASSFAATSLLLGAIFPFVYFSLHEKKLLTFCISIPVICYGFLLITNYHFGPQIQIKNGFSLVVLQIVFFLVPFAGIVTNTYTAVSQRESKTRELAESQQLLRAVFNALFHDLANPATLLFMVSDAAYQSQEMNTKSIERLHRVSDQMKRVLNKLKKMTMISSGKNQLSYEQLSLMSLVQEAIEFAQAQAKSKGVDIIVEDPGIDFWVKVDRDVFVFQVLMNFMSNAIKFTEPGKQITIRFHKLENRVRLEIRDQGVGISPERIHSLTSWKSQTSTRGTNGESGTGLGLPLALKFLEFMGGQITIQSWTAQNHPLNHGTAILVELPATHFKIEIPNEEVSPLRAVS